MSIPSQSGWYFLRFAESPGGQADNSITGWSGYPSYSQQCASGQSQCGVLFSGGSVGVQQELALWVDANTGKIGIPMTAGIPPGGNDWTWIIPYSESTCGSTLRTSFDLTNQKTADGWAISSGGGLRTINGIATWSYFQGYYIDCSNGPVTLWPQFVPATGLPTNITPTQSGWYYLDVTVGGKQGYATVVNGQLSTTSDASQKMMFYFDSTTGNIGYAIPQPLAPTANSSSPIWLSPQITSCGTSPTSVQIGVTSKSQTLMDQGWLILSDGVMRDGAATDSFWTATALNAPISYFCGSLGGKPAPSPPSPVIVALSPVISPITDIGSYLNMILTPVPPNSPDYQQCQGNGGGQLCFYNHSPGTPNVPMFPALNPSPNAVFGYNQNAISKTSSSESPWLEHPGGARSNPVFFLGQPDDALQLNNMQPSVCFDSQCSCLGESPATCALNSDSYCECQVGGSNTVCGLSCAPGLVPVNVSGCKYDPLHDLYISHWQCYPQYVYGIIGSNGSKTCVEYAGKNPPQGTTFTSIQDCWEQWADCPTGYTRYPNVARPGCYRNPFQNYNVCNSGDSCSADDNACGSPGWAAHCHGSCHVEQCTCDCGDTTPMPPFSYSCSDSESSTGTAWVQCQNVNGCPALGASFRVANSDSSGEPFCIPGVTKYAN